jgi:hypothetical protein
MLSLWTLVSQVIQIVFMEISTSETGLLGRLEKEKVQPELF